MYEPREDSYLLQKHVEDTSGDVAIDMCTGTGIIAQTLTKTFDRVIGIDKDKESIQYASSNVENVVFWEHNLFPSHTPQADLITCNPPYLPQSSLKDDELESPQQGIQFSKTFLTQSKKYLKKNGTILLILSTQADKKTLLQHANTMYTYTKIDEVRAFFEKIQLYEFRHR